MKSIFKISSPDDIEFAMQHKDTLKNFKVLRENLNELKIKSVVVKNFIKLIDEMVSKASETFETNYEVCDDT